MTMWTCGMIWIRLWNGLDFVIMMDYVVMMDFCELWFVMMVLCLWMYICIFVAVRFEFELFIFFAGKSTVGAVLDWTALTNTHNRGGWWYSRPYRSPLQGRLILPVAPTEDTVWAAENTSRPYRGTLCRNTLGRAADAAISSETLEPPLQLICVVVMHGLAVPRNRLSQGSERGQV